MTKMSKILQGLLAHHHRAGRSSRPILHEVSDDILWYLNIAMENAPFIARFSIEHGAFPIRMEMSTRPGIPRERTPPPG